MSDLIAITNNMSRSEKMAARKNNLEIAIEQMKKEEASRPVVKLTEKEKSEARKLIRKILEAA